MAKKRGASINKPRKPVRQQREPIAWQKWLQYGFVASVFFVVIASVAWLHQEDTLPIKHVVVAGELNHTTKNELVNAVSPFVKGSFLNVDVASIRLAGEQLPWVKQVQVRRVWPDRLRLIVEEHKAIAYWGDDGLINQNGDVFMPQKNTFPKGLVSLQGYKGSSQLMSQHLLAIHNKTESLGLKVKKITMDERRAWKVLFKNDLQLLLGRADSEQRLQRFVNTFTDGLADYLEQIEVVDMRYTNGLAVVWKQGQKPDFYGTV
jgi:cell division protein FtsQ